MPTTEIANREEAAPSTAAPDPLGGAFHSLNQDLQGFVIGQARAAEHLVIALLADGHVLLQGAPGLAKTRLARLLAARLAGQFQRLQSTPDLLPSDLIGADIYDAAQARFEFRPGPLFANFILADEINRAPAKVQSALLEAMEERQVTSGQTSYRLAPPFFVVATQNPIEHDGTWDLPQAQLDRFLMQINLDYPGAATERQILDLALGEATAALRAAPQAPPTIAATTLAAAKIAVTAVHLAEPVPDFMVRLVAATRDDPAPIPGVGERLSHPASPRGTIMLARAAQARAWLRGRDYVVPEDACALAPDVLRHRIGLSYRAEADAVAPDAIIAAVLDHVPPL